MSDSDDGAAYYARNCHVTARACVALLALARKNRTCLTVDLLRWLTQTMIWPTRSNAAIWDKCNLENTGVFIVTLRRKAEDGYEQGTLHFRRLQIGTGMDPILLIHINDIAITGSRVK